MSLLVATRRTLIAAKQVWDFAAGMPSGASILRSGGNATYFDVAGVLQVASGSDTARRNYNPATLAFEGLYIEAAATNLLTYSDQFDNAAWTKTNVTGSSSSVVETTANGLHGVVQKLAGTYASAMTISAWVALTGRSWLYFASVNTLNNAAVGAYFNLATGAIGSAVGVNGVSGGRSIVYGAALRKIEQKFTHNTGYTTGVGVQAYLATNDGTLSFIGNSAYGASPLSLQLEVGLPTSYIPTTSAAVTRNAESLVLQSVSSSTLRVTFDDNSTQDISVTPGTVTIAATALNRSLVRKVEEL